MLDCDFCGKGYEDFNSLAFHVKHSCKAAPRGSVATPDKEHTMPTRPTPRKMNSPRPAPRPPVPAPAPMPAPPAGQDRPRAARSDMPDPNVSGTQGLPFLTYQNIGNGQADETAYVLFHGLPARKGTGKFGPQLIFKVTVDDQDFQLAIDEGSKSHNEIFRAFKGRWPEGQMIAQVVVSRNGKAYVVILADETLGQ